MSPWDLNTHAFQEPWRLWTGHLAHWGLDQGLANLAACAVPLALLDTPSRRRLLLALPLLMPLLALALLPGLGETAFRGGSGLACLVWSASACGLWVAGRWRMGGLLLGLLGLKLGMELVFGVGPLAQDAQWRVFPAAHLWGLGMGLAFSALAWRRPAAAVNS